MSQNYVPNRSYGRLIFGMPPAEVKAILGEPKSFKSPFEGIPLDDEMKPFVENLCVMEFTRTRRDHAFPQITFDAKRLVAFTLFDTAQPFLVGDIDLFDKNRASVLAALARNENVYYDNGEYFYFPKNGLQILGVKFRKKLPYISLVWHDYEKERIDYNFLEPSNDLGI